MALEFGALGIAGAPLATGFTFSRGVVCHPYGVQRFVAGNTLILTNPANAVVWVTWGHNTQWDNIHDQPYPDFAAAVGRGVMIPGWQTTSTPGEFQTTAIAVPFNEASMHWIAATGPIEYHFENRTI